MSVSLNTNVVEINNGEDGPQPTGILVFERGTRVPFTWKEPFNLGYRVDDFGTEERLPVDTSSVVTSPIDYEVQYAMNAVDTLRRLPVNYISKASFDNFCTELASKLGAALNKSVTITATYDAEDEEYDYAITIADIPEE